MTPRERLRRLMTGERSDACGCLWDFAPLGGPGPGCLECLGSGRLPPPLWARLRWRLARFLDRFAR